ncbi:hypothetical protein SUGI_0987010 [Cryptomeria japonica]|nr:hypothetical protein SUGI_0987010 [Cryptomeria japonica]
MSEKSEAHLLEDFGGLIKLYSDGSVLGNAHPAPRVPDVGGHAGRPYRFSQLQVGSRAPPSLCLRFLHQSAALAAESAGPWLRSHADFSRVFIGGDSEGGNIAYHVGVWTRKAKAEMEIKGVFLLCPSFGCEERTASEKENSPEFSLEMSDTTWRPALPVGSSRDHPFSNPLIEGAAASALDLPPMLFVIAGHDILRDQQLRYCGPLEKSGKQICVHVCEEEEHGFLHVKMEESSSVEALRVISDFIK